MTLYTSEEYNTSVVVRGRRDEGKWFDKDISVQKASHYSPVLFKKKYELVHYFNGQAWMNKPLTHKLTAAATKVVVVVYSHE